MRVRMLAFLVILTVVTMGFSAVCAQSLVVTKEKITAYKAVIEFDLPEPPTPATIVRFEIHTKLRAQCPLTYKPTTASLNGSQLATGEKGQTVLTFQGTVGTLLKMHGNKLIVDPGSCRMGYDELKIVQGLAVGNPTPQKISLLAQ